MMAQLATPRIICYNLCIPITGDPPPAALLGFKFHESCCNDLGVGELSMRVVYEDAEDTDPWSSENFGTDFRACAAGNETGSCLCGLKSLGCVRAPHRLRRGLGLYASGTTHGDWIHITIVQLDLAFVGRCVWGRYLSGEKPESVRELSQVWAAVMGGSAGQILRGAPCRH